MTSKQKSFRLALPLVVLALVIGVVAVITSSPRDGAKSSQATGGQHGEFPQNSSSLTSKAGTTTRSDARSKPAAGGGQRAALAATFESTHICARAYRQADEGKARMAACDALSNYPEAQAKCRAQSGDVSAMMDTARANLEKCGDIGSAETEKAFYASTVAAARNGDVDAQICYLQSDFKLDRPYTEAEMGEFREDGTAYIDAAMKRGDWRVVQLLMTSRKNLGSLSGLLPLLTNGDPVEVYRMNRLARLGATGAYAQQLDATAMDPQQPIPLKEAADANAWAQQTFNAYFASSPLLSERPVACQ